MTGDEAIAALYLAFVTILGLLLAWTVKKMMRR